MTVQMSVAVRNARLDAIEAVLLAAGTGTRLEIRSGAQPANCAAASTGTILATVNLPADPFANANAGSKAMQGSWADNSADNGGTAGHFRFFDQGGACVMQGSVTATGGGGDMTVDNVNFATGQAFSITSFVITGGNA